MTAATANSLVQLMPRLTHQSSAQLMITGTMISSRNGLSSFPSQRPPLEVPTPMPTAPPIFMQVSVPSILKKPGPYVAQALPAPFNGTCRPEAGGLSGFLPRVGSAAAIVAGSITTEIASRMFRIRSFYCVRRV